MKLKLLTALLFCFSTSAFSQSKDIVGSWISQDTLNQVHFFIKSDGTIQKRSATGQEDVWSKAPSIGTYKFQNGKDLLITWKDKPVETISVKFIKGNAEFTVLGKVKSQTFFRIVDEEVIEQK